MSKEIDEKVVRMQFDNSNFESNVQTSLGTIGRLKQSLNFSNSSKSLENIGDAAKSVNMSPLSNAVETVKNKFSGLEVIAVTALANITNSAVNTGKKIVSALTIDPIKDGLSEYELQIKSVQTIMGNTGKDVKTVNKALDELNDYADLTIYNFSDMTQNAGMFTAAGVGLEDTMVAIKGIGNWAAYAGASASDMSRATFQLGQALSSGVIRLQDWMSIEHTAGMAGEKYKEAFMETARQHGIAVDDIVAANGSFRESLKDNWLTTDIFLETMQRFANDQSMTDAATKVKTFTDLMGTLKEALGTGWASSWRIIIGDFEEARDLWTSVSDTLTGFINKSADARNKVLNDWKDLGGRTNLIEGIKNAFEGVLSVVKPVKEAFSEVFDSISGSDLAKFTESFKNLTDKFKLSETTSNNLKRTFKGLFSIFNICKEAIVAIGKSLSPVIEFIAKLVDSFLSVTAVIGDYISAFSDAIEQSGIFKDVIGGVLKLLEPVGKAVDKAGEFVKKFFNSIKTIDASDLTSIGKAISNAFEPVKGVGDFIDVVFEGIGKAVQSFGPGISEVFSKLADALSNLFTFDSASSFMDLLISGSLVKAIKSIKKVFDSVNDTISSVGGIGKSISDMFNTVGDTLKVWQESIKADKLIKIGKAIALLAGSLLVISLIDSDKLGSSLSAIGGLMTELMAGLAVLELIQNKIKTPAEGLKNVFSSGVLGNLIGLSVAILILSAAMKSLSELDWEEIGKGLLSIAGLCGILVGSAKLMSSSSKDLAKCGTNLIMFAAAIGILSLVVKSLGQIDTTSLIKGLVGVGVLCAELAAFLKTADFDQLGILKGTGLLLLATSLVVLTQAVEQLSGLNINELIKGLGSIAVMLSEIVIFTKLIGNPSGMISTATGMLIIGAAMNVLAVAVEKLGNLSWTEIGKGLLTMAGALLIIAGAVHLMPNNLPIISVGLTVMSVALIGLAAALNMMGDMSWEGIAKSLVTLAGSLVILAAAMTVMTGTLAGAAALLIVAGALRILAPVLVAFGNMSWGQIAAGLIMLAGAFTVIGVAGLLLTPLAPTLLMLGAAITLIGVGCLAAGAGITAFAAGLASLIASLSTVGSSIQDFINTLIESIPLLIQKLGEGFVKFVEVIVQNGQVITDAFVTILTALVTAIGEVVPLIVDALLNILTQFLESIAEYSPRIVSAIAETLVSLIETLAEYTPQFVSAGVDLITGFIDGLSENIPRIADSATNLIITFLDAISTHVPEVVDAGMQMIIELINGMANAISSNTPQLVSAMQNLINAIIDAGVAVLTGSVSTFLSKGGELIGGLIDGIKSKIGDVVSAVGSIISSCKEGLANIGSEFISIGSNIIDGLVSGIKSGISSVGSAISDVVSSAVGKAKKLLGIHSPSRVFAEIGMYSDKGLAKGLIKYSNVVTKAAGNVANNMIDVMNNSISKISVDGLDSQPTIRPVFDMSSVEEGADAINGLFAKQQMVSLGIQNRGNINAISNAMKYGKVTTTNDDLVSAINDLKRAINGYSGNEYNINGITYDDGSNISNAVKSIIRAAKVERRR